MLIVAATASSIAPVWANQAVQLASGQNYPVALALDKTNCYWVNLLGGTVMKVPLTGGTPVVLASGQPAPYGVAVDATSVYWTNQGNGPLNPGGVMKVAIGGGTPTLLAPSTGTPAGIAVDATSVYWADTVSGQVLKVAIGGGTATTLASSQSQPTGLAADAANVYWTNAQNGTIRKVAKTGGTTKTLANGQSTPIGIAVNGTDVFWTIPTTGVVRSISNAGGTTHTIATSQSAPTGVAVRGSRVYWTNQSDGTLVESDPLPCRTDQLASSQGTPTGIAVLGSVVAWTNRNTGEVMMLDGWEQHWRGGGRAYAVAVDPAEPGTIYVGTEGGLWKSTSVTTDPNGDLDPHWTPLTNGLNGWVISDIAIDPANRSVVYVTVLDSGVYRSTNAGSSFTYAGVPADARISISPLNHNVVFVGGALPARSTDGGSTWASFSVPSTPSSYIGTFVFDPANANIIYAATAGKVFKSTDAGATWVDKSSGIAAGASDAIVNDQGLAIDSNSTQTVGGVTTTPTLYFRWDAGYQTSRLYKTVDGGNSWSLFISCCFNPTVSAGYNAVAVDPSTNPSSVYTGFYPVSRTADNGASWTVVPPSFAGAQPQVSNGSWSPYQGDIRRILLLPPTGPSQQTFYFADDGGLSRSTDGGATWKTLNKGLTVAPAVDVAVDPKDSCRLWTTVFDYNTGSTTADRGVSWNHCGSTSQFPMFTEVATIAFDPLGTNDLYSFDFSFLPSLGNRHSSSGQLCGVTALGQIPNLPQITEPRPAFDLGHSGTIYVYYGSFGVYKTTNGGTSWQALAAVPATPIIKSMGIAQTNPVTVYAGTIHQGLYKLTEGPGASWSATAFPTGEEVSAVAVDPTNPSRVFAGTTIDGTAGAARLYKSTDGGATWAMRDQTQGFDCSPHPDSNRLGLSIRGVRDIAFDPVNASILYVATYNGLFRSSDGGETFARFETGLISKSIARVLFDPNDSNLLYAGVVGGGLVSRGVTH